MTCDRLRDRLSPYLDGELGSAESRQLEEHLVSCTACVAQLATFRAISNRMQEPALRYAPPAYLESQIRVALSSGTKSPLNIHPAWFAAAACFILAIAMGWIAFVQQPRRAESQIVARQIVSSHIRSLQANHLFDVPSEDRHTVKPWFDGRLSFSPDVRDFPAQGFRLVGGRLDSIEGRTVAALVFRRRFHVISLYVWPGAATDSAPRPAASENGYNTVHWTKDGVNYWAIADIPTDELRQFADLYRE